MDWDIITMLPLNNTIIIFLYGFMGDENVSPPFEKENRGESLFFQYQQK